MIYVSILAIRNNSQNSTTLKATPHTSPQHTTATHNDPEANEANFSIFTYL